MTEKDLFAYRRALSEYRRACDELREFCPTFYSANVSAVTGLPKGAPPASPDRLSSGIEVYTAYIERWRAAVAEMERARELLSAVNKKLEHDSEKQYLYFRYVKGMRNSQITKQIHRSSSSLWRDRTAILALISSMTYPV